MPKKKSPANGFSLFLNEVRHKLIQEGKSFNTGHSNELSLIVQQSWERLTQEERDAYNTKGKQIKKEQNATLKGKFNSEGVLLADILRKEADEKNRINNMCTSIKNWIQRIPTNEDVANEKFYLISFNITCQILVGNSNDETEYIPNEVGLVEYSLSKGIMRYFHTFIKPSTLPMGYGFTAKQHSEDTHQIPYIGFDLADDNYVGIWIQMKNFINQDQSKEINPPVFARSEQLEQTRSCLNWLHYRSREQFHSFKKVYNLTNLILELKSRPTGISYARSEAESLLNKNDFDYSKNTCCDWHEDKDCTYCALGVVRRLGFLMSDALCNAYGVEVTSSHLPEQADPFKSLTPQASIGWNSGRRPIGASKISQPSSSWSTQDSSSRHRSNEPIEEVEFKFSQVSVNRQPTEPEDEEINWITVGRGAGRYGSSKNQPLRQPGKPTIGRGRGLL